MQSKLALTTTITIGRVMEALEAAGMQPTIVGPLDRLWRAAAHLTVGSIVRHRHGRNLTIPTTAGVPKAPRVGRGTTSHHARS